MGRGAPADIPSEPRPCDNVGMRCLVLALALTALCALGATETAWDKALGFYLEGRSDQALVVLETLLKEAPAHQDAAELRARILEARAEEKRLLAARTASPKSPHALRELAEFHARETRLDEAEKELIALLGLKPGDGRATFLLDEVRRLRKKPVLERRTLAVQAVTRAMGMRDGMDSEEREAEPPLRQAEAWYAEGDYPRAEKILDALLKREPENAGARQLKEIIVQAKKDEKSFRGAIARSPRDVPAHLDLVLFLLKEGRLDAAEAALVALLAVKPDHYKAGQLLPAVRKGLRELQHPVHRAQFALKLFELSATIPDDIDVKPAKAPAPGALADRCNEADPALSSAPLAKAAASGDRLALDKALRAGANVNATFGPFERTALLCAIETGHSDLALVLLANGADPTRPNPVGTGPLHFAALDGSPELVRALVEKGADPSKANRAGMIPFDFALSRALRGEKTDSIAVLKAFLALPGTDRERRGFSGRTPLQRAVALGKRDVAEVLLEAGASTATVDPDTIADPDLRAFFQQRKPAAKPASEALPR